MPNFSVNHIAIAVQEVKKSIAFYQKVFQLEEIEHTVSTTKTPWLVFADERQLQSKPRRVLD